MHHAGAGVGVEPHQFQYPGESNAQVVVYATGKNAAAGLAKSVTEAAAAAIKEKGSFTLVLSGGRTAGGQQQLRQHLHSSNACGGCYWNI